jgi:hypothetical protein
MLTASQTNDDEGPSSSVRRAVPNSGQVPIGDKDYWLDVALRQLSVQRSNFIDAVRLVVSGKFIRDRRSITIVLGTSQFICLGGSMRRLRA